MKYWYHVPAGRAVMLNVLNAAEGVVDEMMLGRVLGSLGHVRMLSCTPQIVRFSQLPEFRLKFTALYIGACSVNGSMRTKTLWFSTYLHLTTPVAQVDDVEPGGPPLKFE